MFWIRYCFIGFVAFLIWALLWANRIDTELDFSPVLYSKEGRVLSMKTAKDGQWRFMNDSLIPILYEQALLQYEDKNFYHHLGIDPIGIIRATFLNLKNKKIVSGGSTITMQLARLYVKSKNRNIFSKLSEIILAIGLEARYSKKELLSQYSNMAPMGANVVGIDAAMFRYYNKKITQLSWAEAALLAVLPNQPSWLHLAKNRSKLLDKRNHLLLRLKESGRISNADYELALLEPLPDRPSKIQRLAPHALDYLQKRYPRLHNFNTTIDASLQELIKEIALRHHELLKQNEIRNASILLIDNQTQEVLTYIGNILADTIKAPFAEVNMIHSSRSSGSVLKPLLIASAIDKGMISTHSLIPDIPVMINGFRPENFSRTYMGACTAHELIKYSLNIPSILLLKDLGISQFNSELEKLNFTNLFRKPMEYGLSLVLGGAEINMWDLATAYSYLLYSQQNYDKHRHKYLPVDSFSLKILQSDEINERTLISTAPVYSAGSISDMFITMRNPPPGNTVVESSGKELSHVAWKTGTSFGYKDAWCLGITPDYTLVVWVGNSNGLPRPGLIGVETAAPLMFDIMNRLSGKSEWLPVYDNKTDIHICRQSGFIASEFCNEIDSINVSASLQGLKTCSYHRKIFLDSTEKFQVYSDCEMNPIEKNYFILPPLMAYYYQQKQSNYIHLPPVREDCLNAQSQSMEIMEFIYPTPKTDIVLPYDLDEKKNSVVFKAVHKDPDAKVYWHLDNSFLGSTENKHEILTSPDLGEHWLAISDESGHSLKIKFWVKR